MGKSGIGSQSVKMMLGATQIKKAYVGNHKVYSAGNIVRFHIDTNVIETMEYDNGQDIIPTAPTPTKEGYSNFIGWRPDSLASSMVTQHYIMQDEPVDLYAVFSNPVKLNYRSTSGGQTNTTETKYAYYNNGNSVNPKFRIADGTYTDMTFIGWSTGTAADETVNYEHINNTPFAASVTLYAKFRRVFTLNIYNDSATAQVERITQYYNTASSNYYYPLYQLSLKNKTGYTRRGWATAADSKYKQYNPDQEIVVSSSPLSVYGLYLYKVTLTTIANGGTYLVRENNEVTYNSSGTQVDRALFYIPNPSKTGATFLGWSTSSSSTNVAEPIVSGSSQICIYATQSTTRYAVFQYNNDVITKKSWENSRFTWIALGTFDMTKYTGGNVVLTLDPANTDKIGEAWVNIDESKGGVHVYYNEIEGTHDFRTESMPSDWFTGNKTLYLYFDLEYDTRRCTVTITLNGGGKVVG